jgi:hypothetical protein
VAEISVDLLLVFDLVFEVAGGEGHVDVAVRLRLFMRVELSRCNLRGLLDVRGLTLVSVVADLLFAVGLGSEDELSAFVLVRLQTLQQQIGNA